MPLADLNALAPRIQGVIAGIPEIAAAYVFGSVARGAAREDSDLDIGVVYRARRFTSHAQVAPRVAAELARATGFEHIDVVDLAAQGPIFAHRALCDGRLVYEGDRRRRIDFESDTMRDAFDFMPTYRIATAGKPAALRRWLQERYGV